MRVPALLALLAACSPAPRSAPSAPAPPAAPPDVPHLVVLGIAQDAGHPQAACTRTCCTRVRAGLAPGHRVASLGLVDGEHRVLFEATPDLPSQLAELSPDGRLDGIFLTHAHIGHYTGLMHLGREAMGARAVPVWAMPRMHEFLARDRPWSLLVDQGHVALSPLADGVPVRASPRVQVTPFRVPHRDEISETVGFRIAGPDRTAVFLPDIDKWSRWATPIEELLASVDVAWLDATFHAAGEIDRDMASIPHPFVVETLERLAPLPAEERAKVRFIHLNHSNPLLSGDAEAFGIVREAGVRVAQEGEVEPL